MILGVDPGTQKAGYALVSDGGAIVARGIATVDGLYDIVVAFVRDHAIRAIALGDSTNAAPIARRFEALAIPVVLTDERESTLQARALYFADHPRRGWRRLVPVSMQVPPRPVDDYAAAIIARRYLDAQGVDGKRV